MRVQSKVIGIGSGLTWHGHPDGLADWAPLQSDEDDPTGSDSDSSAGGKTAYDPKTDFSIDAHGIDQLLGQSVVMSHITCTPITTFLNSSSQNKWNGTRGQGSPI